MGDQAEAAAGIAAYAVLIFFGGVTLWFRRRQEAKRLRSFVGSRVMGFGPTTAQVLRRTPDTSGIAVGLNRKLGDSSFGQQLQIQLVRSGLTITPHQLVLAQIAVGSLLFLIGRFLVFPTQGALSVPLSMGLALPAVVLPRFVLKYLEKRRVTRFENQLAQSVDVMAGALSAGTSLAQSLELVSREMPSPIGEEFGRMVHEASIAVPMDQALNNMLERVPSLDLEMLVSAINIQYRVGGNLSHILKTIAHTIRERVRIRGELSTLTAQARLSSYIISGMPVAVVLILFVVSPDYISKLFDEGITRVMLVSGIVGIISGYYIMKRIATIEV
jgi:tight adherence protein B